MNNKTTKQPARQAQAEPRAKVVFLSIATFKKMLQIEGELTWKEDIATGARSIVTDDGRWFKIASNFDNKLPKKFLLEEGKDITEACLVNVKETVKKTLGVINED